MKRHRTSKHGHLFEATAIAGGVMILVLVALGIDSSGPTYSAAVLNSDIVAFTNIERARNELNSLTENSVLNAAAQAKANDMAAKGYFSHTGPGGELPWSWFVAAGYDYRYAGENLAVRFSDSREVVNAWMASPTHKANIVKSQYTEIGIGVADGTYQGQPVTFVVQFFATPSVAYSERRGTPQVAITEPVLATAQSAAAPTRTNSGGAVVAGVETSAPPPTKSASIFDRIANFFSVALRSLTASVADSGLPAQAGGVIIAGGVSTER